MKIFAFSPILTRPLPLIAAALVLAGCNAQPPPADDIDLSEATDLFKTPVASTSPNALPDDQIIARVNGRAIRLRQIKQEAAMVAGRLRGQMAPEQIEQQKDAIANQSLNNLITQAVLLAEIERENISVPDADVDKQLATLKESLPAELSFEEYLTRSGISEEVLRGNMRREMRVQLLIKQKAGVVPPPSEEEVATFFEEQRERFQVPESVKAEHLTVPVAQAATEEADAEAAARAAAIQKRWAGGEAFTLLFEALADEGVRGATTAFIRPQLSPDMAESLFNQPVETVGEVIKSRAGYHVFRVLEKNPERALTLDESKEQISAMLIQQRQQQSVQTYIEEARGRAQISMENQP